MVEIKFEIPTDPTSWIIATIILFVAVCLCVSIVVAARCACRRCKSRVQDSQHSQPTWPMSPKAQAARHARTNRDVPSPTLLAPQLSPSPMPSPLSAPPSRPVGIDSIDRCGPRCTAPPHPPFVPTDCGPPERSVPLNSDTFHPRPRQLTDTFGQFGPQSTPPPFPLSLQGGLQTFPDQPTTNLPSLTSCCAQTAAEWTLPMRIRQETPPWHPHPAEHLSMSSCSFTENQPRQPTETQPAPSLLTPSSPPSILQTDSIVAMNLQRQQHQMSYDRIRRMEQPYDSIRPCRWG